MIDTSLRNAPPVHLEDSVDCFDVSTLRLRIPIVNNEENGVSGNF